MGVFNQCTEIYIRFAFDLVFSMVQISNDIFFGGGAFVCCFQVERDYCPLFHLEQKMQKYIFNKCRNLK